MLQIGFLRESKDSKRVYQEWIEYTDYKSGLGNHAPRFNPDDWIAGLTWSSSGPSDYSYNFTNKYRTGCVARIIIRLNGKQDYRGTDNCSKAELQELTDYIDTHWQELSVAKYRK